MKYLLLYWILTLLHGRKSDCEEYCNEEEFKATCEKTEIVIIKTAKMGRMNTGKCVTTDFGYLGCQDDVRGILDKKCSGRRNCSVRVADADLAAANVNCNSEFKTYLEVTYKCQPVINKHSSFCKSTNKVILREPSGYLANVLTDETGCGSELIPWEIQTTPGKTINITLFDFGWQETNRVSFTGSCYSLATVYEEGATGVQQDICAQKGKNVTHAYRSITNVLQVRMIRKHLPRDRDHFMLHYQVIGCNDPPLKKGNQLKRVGDKAFISCEGDEDTRWTITCSGDNWKGFYGNCTKGLMPPITKKRVDNNKRSKWWLPFPWDISIALIAGVAFVIGCCIFVVGLFVLRRRNTDEIRRRQQCVLLREAQDVTFGKYPSHPNPTDPHFKVEPTFDSQGRSVQNPSIENEYAYVSDFPPPPSPKTLRMCSKDQSKQTRLKTKPWTPAGSHRMNQQQVVSSGSRQPNVPEQYFELDMFNSDRRKSS